MTAPVEVEGDPGVDANPPKPYADWGEDEDEDVLDDLLLDAYTAAVAVTPSSRIRCRFIIPNILAPCKIPPHTATMTLDC